jgi:hypothetical protein
MALKGRDIIAQHEYNIHSQITFASRKKQKIEAKAALYELETT